MVFLLPNVVFSIIALAILKVMSISCPPGFRGTPYRLLNLSNPANARRYTEHVAPIGSDTFNPGTLSHPATVAVDPLEAILDESGLGALDGHNEGSSNNDEGEGPLDGIAHMKARTEYVASHRQTIDE
ncbi:hypothetical protein F4604DRAFT_1712570 [Suillus subluteus]|nr:hypothetical protein F4604DRAFT_1712570 [Suillus subluteus]